MSVSSMTPLTCAACGPIAAIRTSVPVCCWLRVDASGRVRPPAVPCRGASAASRARRRSPDRRRPSRRSAGTGWPLVAGRLSVSQLTGAVAAVRGLRLGHRAVPLERHGAAGEEPEHGLLEVLHRAQLRRVGNEAVALLRLRVLLHGLRRAVEGVVVARLAAAEDHVDVVIDLLLGDRAQAAGGLGLVRAAVAGVVRALAAAQADVRGEHGGRRVGDLGSRHVAGGHAALLRELEDGPVAGVVARHLDRCARALRDALVDRLAAGRPSGAGRGRVGHVVGQVGRPGARLQRPRRLLAREREGIHSQVPAGAGVVVAGGGDLRVAHAVAEEHDHVLGLAIVDLAGQDLHLVRSAVRGHDRRACQAGGDDARASQDPARGLLSRLRRPVVTAR
jgi:hypothetical protein